MVNFGSFIEDVVSPLFQVRSLLEQSGAKQ